MVDVGCELRIVRAECLANIVEVPADPSPPFGLVVCALRRDEASREFTVLSVCG